MGKFVITSSKVTKTYGYSDENIFVSGQYQADENTGMVQTIQGSCYHPVPGGAGEYIGTFTGVERNGEIKYSLSEMSRKDSMLVWNAIDEIEQNILPQEEL